MLGREIIFWGDEAHFYLNQTVNTQNCQIWNNKSPNALAEIPLHSADNCVMWFHIINDYRSILL